LKTFALKLKIAIIFGSMRLQKNKYDCIKIDIPMVVMQPA